jgi:hypothetical protein
VAALIRASEFVGIAAEMRQCSIIRAAGER